MKLNPLALLLLLSILFFGNTVRGQTVVFDVSPEDAFVRVNGQVIDLSQTQRMQFAPGTYEAEIWAPRLKVATHRFTVTADRGEQTVSYGMRSNKSVDYENYSESLKQYRRQRLNRQIRTGVAAAATAASAVGFLALAGSDGRAIADDIRGLETAFETAVVPEAIDGILARREQLIGEYAEKQDRQRTAISIGIPLTVVLATLTTYTIIRYARRPLNKPTYTPVNPFVALPPATPPRSYVKVGSSRRGVGLSLTF